jgi:hypothetical protein
MRFSVCPDRQLKQGRAGDKSACAGAFSPAQGTRELVQERRDRLAERSANPFFRTPTHSWI